MAGMGRHPPQPRHQPFAFYSAVRLGDPELLARIMQARSVCRVQGHGVGRDGMRGMGGVGEREGGAARKGPLQLQPRRAAPRLRAAHAALRAAAPRTQNTHRAGMPHTYTLHTTPCEWPIIHHNHNTYKQVDPYFVTQDNGAGAPLHFAVTYRQLDMVCGAMLVVARGSVCAHVWRGEEESRRGWWGWRGGTAAAVL